MSDALGESGTSSAVSDGMECGRRDARFFRALGDPTRIAIIRLVLVRPHSVSELIDKLGVPQSRVSNHLACLRWCGFVISERKGRQIIYSIRDARLCRLLELASEMIGDNNKNLTTTTRLGPRWL